MTAPALAAGSSLSDGAVISHTVYDPWGTPLTATYPDANFAGIDNRSNYTGYTWGEVLELYFAQNRFYDAETHRFTQEDTVKDGSNWYVYCANSPVRYVDRTGGRYDEGNPGDANKVRDGRIDEIVDIINQTPPAPAPPTPPPPPPPAGTTPSVPINSSLPSVSYTMSEGAVGGSVKTLQQALNNCGASLSNDGSFGPATKKAVEEFQRENGLSVTGRADQATLMALDIWGGSSTILPVELLSVAEVAVIGAGKRQAVQVLDLLSGKTFNISWAATAGYHTDWSPLTQEDTDIIKSILNPNVSPDDYEYWSKTSSWSWDARPGVITIDGLQIAVGYHLRPHANIMGGSPGSPLRNPPEGNGINGGPPASGWTLGGHMCMYYGNNNNKSAGQYNEAAKEAYKMANGLP